MKECTAGPQVVQELEELVGVLRGEALQRLLVGLRNVGPTEEPWEDPKNGPP